MIQVRVKTFDDEFSLVSDNTVEVTLGIARQQFDVLMAACRRQGIRVQFELCDEQSIAISTSLSRDGLAVGLRFTPCEGEDPSEFLHLLAYVKQTEGR